MRPHRATALVATSIVLVLGCASISPSPTIDPRSPSPASTPAVPPLADVPFFRADPAANGIHPGPGPTGKPELAWRADVGDMHMVPILAQGLLIVGANDGRLVALDAHTGEARWTYQASDAIKPSLAAVGGVIYASDGSALHAVDVASGSRRWSTPVDDTVGRVNAVDGVVYVGSTGAVLGLDGRTGEIVWRWDGPPDIPIAAGPVVDGVGYFAARDGRVYAIDIQSRRERWRVQTISLDVPSGQVVGETFYVSTNQGEAAEPVGEIYAIDRASGDIRWRFRAPSGLQLKEGPVKDGVLYANGRADGIWALRDDGSQATVLWHIDTPESHWPMALVGDVLYQVRVDGSLGAYDVASQGELLWETDAEGNWAGGPIVSGGMVFLANDSTGAMAFADPALIARLPKRVAKTSPLPSSSSSEAFNPFTVVRAFTWDATGIEEPLGMEAGPDGLLYIFDTKPQVTVINPTVGHVVRRWGRQGAGPSEFDVARPDDNMGYGDIAVAPDGRVYVADGSNHRVQLFSPEGEFQFQFGSFGTGDGQFGSINEIAIGSDGSVYVQDGQISKFTADGKFVWRTDEGAVGLAVRSDGVLLGTCEGCKQILLLDPEDGRIRGRMDLPGIDGDGFGLLSLDPDGNIFIGVYGSASQMVFDRNGKLLGADYLEPDEEITRLGRTIIWGDTWFPSPVVLPNGRAFIFGKDGLLELKVTLP